MRVRGTHYQEVIDHLPEGATLVLQDVAWEDYEQSLLSDRRDASGRFTGANSFS
jgi:hypothetical protein